MDQGTHSIKLGTDKGQLISKYLFSVFNFLQKKNSSKVKFVCSFFGGNVSLKKCFDFIWHYPKLPQVPQNLSAKFVCQSQKGLDFNKKGFVGRPYSVLRMVVWWLLFDRIFCKRNKVRYRIGFYFIFHCNCT